VKRERSVTIVRGYEPAFGQPPADVRDAGLTTTVAAVLSTHRSQNPDSVRDHPLWLACMRSVTEASGADEAEVYGAARRGLLSRLLRRRGGPSLGALDAYAAGPAPDWAFIRWRRAGVLVAAAQCEPWDLVGGPDRYHDSYTTCVFVAPSLSAAVVDRMRRRVEEEGGQASG